MSSGEPVGIGVPDVSSAQKVGEGGFGAVYKAHQDSFDRTVAVKILSDSDIDGEARERFSREIRAIGRLSDHPNIVSVYEHGTTEGGAPYLVMEFCDRGSYGDLLRRHPVSWDEATEVAVKIAEALEASHRAGILHRDVKPDNILIDRFGVPKLADFGISKSATQETLTGTGKFIGSPQYMAPEIILGHKPSPASDVYSLASSMYALIAGQPPFVRGADTSLVPLLHRVANDEPPSLRDKGVPAQVADVVRWAMAKDPSARPATCAVFVAELRRARQAAQAGATALVGWSSPQLPASQPAQPQWHPPNPQLGATPPGGGYQPAGGRHSGLARRLVPILIVVGVLIFLVGVIGLVVFLVSESGNSPGFTGWPETTAPLSITQTPSEDVRPV